MKPVDLRSDTITRPSLEMRRMMAEADVGDDVFGEDPTVNRLEEWVARLLGKESALFVPSGTMANQIAIRVYGRPGDEVLVMDDSHVFFYEGGGAAGISGVQLQPIPLINGLFEVSDFVKRIRFDDPHFPVTKAFWIENTHNRGGGRIVPLDLMNRLYHVAREHNKKMHVDGARLVNASVATNIPLCRWASCCDSLSLCFSKGLGAPIGSILAGDREFIHLARRARKTLGGGMRQAGILAAAAIFALQQNVARLADDHARAKFLVENLAKIDGIRILLPVETNIVMIDLDSDVVKTADEIQAELKESNVLMLSVSTSRLRAVTHLDIDDEAIDRTIDAFKKMKLYK